MKAVGVRELKARLSRYLREVQAGEVILVTDRGRVVAELRAPGPAGQSESYADRALRRLAETGALRIGEPHDPAGYRASPVRARPGTARELLDEERDEP
jgi:antitoxin (DNA-binding transcriptional repressor) of toxin-antitoxin stability system